MERASLDLAHDQFNVAQNCFGALSHWSTRRCLPSKHFDLVRLGLADAARGVAWTPDRIDADGSECDAGILLRLFEHAAGDIGRVVRPYDEGKFGQQHRREDE